MKKQLKAIGNRFKENRWILLVFLLIWAVFAFLTLHFYKNTLGMESIGNSSSDAVVELNRDTKLKQMMFSVDGAESFSVRFATYARKNQGNVNILIRGLDTGKVYLKETIDVKSIEDNSFLTLSFNEPISADKDSDLLIELTSDSEVDQAVGVYYSAGNILENGAFTINDVPVTGDLVCKQLIDNEYYQTYSNIVISLMISTFTLLVFLIALDVRKEILFTLMVFFLGFIFLMVMTPMSVPDEQFHYESAYQIVSNLFHEDHTIMDVAYRNYSHFGGHENVPTAYKRLLEHFNDPLEMKEKYETVAIDIDLLQYLVYFFPQTLGVLIGRVLKLNFLRTFYLGRFTNLLFYVMCVYYAIRKTPVLKTLLGILCCTPIVMQQCGSYSYDAFVNGMCMIVVSSFLKWMHDDEKISVKEMIVVFLAVLLLSPAKKVYALFVLPFFFVPVSHFGSRKNKVLTLLFISCPAVFILVQMLWPPLMRIFNRINQTYNLEYLEPKMSYAGAHIDLGPLKSGDDVDPSQFEDRLFTIGFIVEYPIYTIKLIYRTVRFNLKKWFYESVGRTLSGASLVLPLRLIQLLSACLILSSLVKEERVIPVLVKIVIMLVCIAVACMILMGFLLTWTNRRDEMIQGVQGRYFSPLLPYFFSTFNNKYVKLPKWSDRYLIFAHLLMMFYVVIYILSSTFIN
jgi:uncharacterized membrane protein